MPTVDISRLKGNYAQAVVVSWLSRACLVRPVAEGTDIGIDLYCESVLDGQPFLHFWVQVKAIPAENVTTKDGRTGASYAFETKHLAYWDRQPIPVYALLVPLPEWPPTAPRIVYGVRVTEALVRDGLPSTASRTLRTSDSFELSTIDADLLTFVTEIVPWDTAVLGLKRGIVSPLPARSDDAPQRFPRDIGWQYLERTLSTIRDAAMGGLYHALIGEKLGLGSRELRGRFEAIVRLYGDDIPDFGLSMLVRAAHTDGDLPRARRLVQRALVRFDSDQTRSPEERRQRAENLRALLNELDERS